MKAFERIVNAFHILILYSDCQFQVEYIDLSGQVQLASAEAPNEALPHDCRPNFGVAWLSKDEFKVNLAFLYYFQDYMAQT